MGGSLRLECGRVMQKLVRIVGRPEEAAEVHIRPATLDDALEVCGQLGGVQVHVVVHLRDEPRLPKR
eukprot:1040355-Prymnesium_polylepis.1